MTIRTILIMLVGKSFFIWIAVVLFIGAWVCKKFAHNGFATEGTKALEAYFFKMGFHKMSAKANVKNKASCGTLKKLGLKKDGVERSAIFNKWMQEWGDFAVFSKLASEYKK